jgi:Secretion system C-terminal sorting domain
MKQTTKILFASAVLVAGMFTFADYSGPAHGNKNGAPAGRTGSPGDGSNCSVGCHTGQSVTAALNAIQTSVPSTGYVPGQTYTVFATINSVGAVRYGFEISPQNTAGAQKGTMTVTTAGLTQLVGSGKYMTHTSSSVDFAGGTAAWTFNWTAPAVGSGPVTFYGAFNITNSSNTSSGDMIKTDAVTVQENTTGIDEVTAFSNQIDLFPNPASNIISFKSDVINFNSTINLNIFDINGKMVKRFEKQNATNIDIDDLQSGYYVLRVETDKGIAIKKLIKE